MKAHKIYPLTNDIIIPPFQPQNSFKFMQIQVDGGERKFAITKIVYFPIMECHCWTALEKFYPLSFERLIDFSF